MNRFNPLRAQRFDGRIIVVALLLLYAIQIAIREPGADRAHAWKQVGVLAGPSPFMDLIVFDGARKAFAAHEDPYRVIPGDPYGRPYNYPRLWLAFMRFPVDPASLSRVGAGLAVAAAAAVLLFWGRLSPAQGVLGGVLLCSPAVMLGVERGNSDLVVFTLVALGLLLPARRGGWWLGVTTLLAAALLKLYPIVGLAAWIGPRGRRGLGALAVAASLFAGYVAWNFHDVIACVRNAEKRWVVSYGAHVGAEAWASVVAFHQGRALVLELPNLLATALAGLIVVGVVVGARATRGGRNPFGGAAEQHRIGFRVGALIYLATFLVGNSFDYRLIFVLLVYPALWTAGATAGSGRTLARLCLGLLPLLLTMNYFVAGWTGFWVKQIAAWTLLAGLANLLAQDFLAGPDDAAAATGVTTRLPDPVSTP